MLVSQTPIIPTKRPPTNITPHHPTRVSNNATRTATPQKQHDVINRKSVRPTTRPNTAPTTQHHHHHNHNQQKKKQLVKDDVRPKTPSSLKKRTLSVVLPPRNLSSSSTTTMIEELIPPIVIRNLHFEESYSPHKAHWIKSALENLGTGWIREGKTTYEQLMSEEFEEKMGVFYDLAMAKKHDAIDRLVGDDDGDDENGGGGHGGVSGGVVVHKNFPFSKSLSVNVKSSMSDALLKIILKNETKEQRGSNDSGKKDESTSSNSFERELRTRKSLVMCYVVDGGKLVIGSNKGLVNVGGSFVNRFLDSKESRVRKNPQLMMLESNLGFYRRIANMMGFLPHEIKIRYCRTSRQVVVSGARPQRDNENARQVREVLELPKNVDVRNLIVMRTTKGSLIFEEAAS